MHLQDSDVLTAELQQHYRDALQYLYQKRAVFKSLPPLVLENFFGVFLTLKRGISQVETWLSWSDEVAAMLGARKWQQLTPEGVQLYIGTLQGDGMPHPGKSAKNGWKITKQDDQQG